MHGKTTTIGKLEDGKISRPELEAEVPPGGRRLLALIMGLTSLLLSLAVVVAMAGSTDLPGLRPAPTVMTPPSPRLSRSASSRPLSRPLYRPPIGAGRYLE